MKKTLLAAILLTSAITSHAQYRMATTDDIITLTKTRESTRQIVDLYLNGYQKKRPEIPADVWKKIGAEIDYTPFINEVSALYKKNYTPEELSRMAAYLRSNDQQKYGVLAKRIEKDLYAVSNNFGKNLALRVEEKLKALGY
jgi:hypothetical protein